MRDVGSATTLLATPGTSGSQRLRPLGRRRLRRVRDERGARRRRRHERRPRRLSPQALRRRARRSRPTTGRRHAGRRTGPRTTRRSATTAAGSRSSPRRPTRRRRRRQRRTTSFARDITAGDDHLVSNQAGARAPAPTAAAATRRSRARRAAPATSRSRTTAMRRTSPPRPRHVGRRERLPAPALRATLRCSSAAPTAPPAPTPTAARTSAGSPTTARASRSPPTPATSARAPTTTASTSRDVDDGHDDPRLGRQRVRGRAARSPTTARSSRGSTARRHHARRRLRPDRRVRAGRPAARRYVSRPPARRRSSRRRRDEAEARHARISADGRYVVFTGDSTHLPGTMNGPQVYRRDMLTGALELVARTDGRRRPGTASSQEPSISADGTRVASRASRGWSGGHGRRLSVYVRDVAAGTTTLVSRADGAAGAVADLGASSPRISAGGRHVGLPERRDEPRQGRRRHPRLPARRRAGRRSSSTGRPAARSATSTPTRSASRATGGWSRSRRARTTSTPPTRPPGRCTTSTCATPSRRRRRSSRAAAGADGAKATGSALDPVLSADGRVIAFVADDEPLAPEGGAWGGNRQVVVRDLASGQNALGSRALSRVVADADAADPSIDGDGSVVAFTSAATNRRGVGGGGRGDVFARTLATGAGSGPLAFGIVEGAAPDRTSASVAQRRRPVRGVLRRRPDQFTGAAGDIPTDYVYVISGSRPKPLSRPGARRRPPPARRPPPRGRRSPARP